MGIFSTKIKVEFINASDGSIIGTSKLPLDQLPETFEIETTMDLGSEKWTVASAKPPTKSEFSKLKSLKLTMNKVEMININDINYTLPTISNELPIITQSASFNGPSFNIREDDWRQLEFLPKSSRDNVEIETRFIKGIWENHSKVIDKTFNTFSKLHVRETIGIPSTHISLSELKSILNVDQVSNLTISDSKSFVENGFSIDLGTHVFYGTVQNDIIQSLCLDKINEDSEKSVHKINSSFNLIFANWYYHEIVE
jgi:hypothetical protein